MKTVSPAKTKRRDEHLKPINVSQEIWLYAERGKLCVVRHKNCTGTPDSFFIPWRYIERALEIAPRRCTPSKRKQREIKK